MLQALISILLLSAAGSLLTLVLLLLKPITRRKFGSRWQYYIWITVLIVMILPVHFELPFLQANNLTVPPLLTQHAISQNAITGGMAAETQPFSTEAASSKGVAGQIQQEGINALGIGDFLGLVWISGAVLFALCGLVSYIRFLATVRRHAVEISCPQLEELQADKGVYKPILVKKTTVLSAPLLVGVFRPILLLPDTELGDQDLRYILLHELTHYKRRDLLYKWFSFVVNAIHWFNPFIYLAVRQINEACEISCDIAVTGHMNDTEKRGYMTAIIRLAAEKGGMLHV